MKLICNKHGVSEHRKSKDRYKCKNCEYDYSRKYLQNLKLKAIKSGGGECSNCGYDKCWRALHFHHIDPSQKDYNIFENRPGYKKVRNWDELKKEISKCILLCANCHTEIHYEDQKKEEEQKKYTFDKTYIYLMNKSIISGKKTPEQIMESLIS